MYPESESEDKYMKKITAIFVCLLLVASLAVTAFAAEKVQVTLAANKTSASKGDVIDVTISISEMAECRSAGLIVIYDKTVFEFVKGSGECTQEDANMPQCKIVGTNLSCSFTYDVDATPASISGKLFSFQMKVLDTAAFAESEITLKSTSNLKNKAGESATLEIAPVKVSIVCANHTPVTNTTKEATCKEAGEKVTTCSVCNAELGKESIEKLPHTPVTNTTKEATCKEAGEKVTTCSVCNEQLSKETVAKLPHTPVTTTTKEATCKEAGEKVTSCSVCNEVIKTEEIAKLPHTLGEFTETKAPTCAAEGEKTATCSVCNETVTEAIAKLEHTWDEGKVTTEPTTKKEGVKTFTCTVCGETKTEAIAKLETPKTDDNSMIIPFVLLMILSAAGVAVTVIGKKRVA